MSGDEQLELMRIVPDASGAFELSDVPAGRATIRHGLHLPKSRDMNEWESLGEVIISAGQKARFERV